MVITEGSGILVVDDDQETCQNLKQLLQLDGYQIQFAASATAARALGDWPAFFAIILDSRLPGGSAEELLSEVKTKSPRTAVIIISGCPEIHASISARAREAEDFFLKPLDPEVLRASLIQIARARRAEARAAESERLAVIGQTMAAISHESRNATQRIQTGIDMLRLELSNMPTAMAEVNRIEAATNDLKSMLDEVRDFAAPVTLKLSDVDLSEVWRNAWNNVIRVGDNGHARLRENLNHSDLHCHVDDFRMEQVFRNIFENSLAACNGDPVVQIECREPVDEANPSSNAGLRISIRDNGPGFSDDQSQRIFEPFYTTKQKGTGLGMAIVKRTIEAHGGSVRVGKKGQPGAEIVLSIPRSDCNKMS